MPNEPGHQTRLERILGVPLAADAVRQWPQSGELVRGRERIGEVESHFLGLRLGVGRRIAWGNTVVVEWTTDYGDGRLYRNVSIADLRDGKAAPFTTVAELLDQFDRHVREARAALLSTPDAAMGVTWTLKNRGATVFSAPRAGVLRSFILSHMIHHRGQLSVYLRLRDVPVPSVYGPTADTRG